MKTYTTSKTQIIETEKDHNKKIDPYRIDCAEIDAVQLEIEMSNNIEEYAMNFLHIFNNARENRKIILSLKNEYNSNKVYVICPKKKADDVANYLEQFAVDGKVNRFNVVAIQPIISTDFDEWDEDEDYECAELVNAIMD